MFGLIKQAFGVIMGIVLAVTIIICVPLIAAIQILSDRENPRKWLKTDQMKDQYVSYIVDSIVSDSDLSLIELVSDGKKVKETVRKELSDEWIDDSINQLVDSTYDWLEGKVESPSLKLVPNTDDINQNITDSLGEKFGALGSLIDFSNIKFIDSEIEVFQFSEKINSYIPTLYQRLVDLPQKLLIAMGVIAAITFLSASNSRKGAMLLGIFGALSAVFIMWGPSYITQHPEVLTYIKVDSSKLPSIEALPDFVKELGGIASKDISKRAVYYAKFILGGSVVLFVLSQLSVKTVEVDEDEDEIKKPIKRREIEDEIEEEEKLKPKPTIRAKLAAESASASTPSSQI